MLSLDVYSAYILYAYVFIIYYVYVNVIGLSSDYDYFDGILIIFPLATLSGTILLK